jgi:hypothetical protein
MVELKQFVRVAADTPSLVTLPDKQSHRIRNALAAYGRKFLKIFKRRHLPSDAIERPLRTEHSVSYQEEHLLLGHPRRHGDLNN